MRETTMSRYLKTIWLLEEYDSSQASVMALTNLLARSPATISQGIQTLNDGGFVVRRPYGPVTLTERGRKLAVAAVRQERVARVFLQQILAWPWAGIAEEAARLSIALSNPLVERIHSMAGSPPHDPYGHPIPDETGSIRAMEDVVLSTRSAGSCVHVTRVDERDRGVLEKLGELGLLPGEAVLVLAVDERAECMTISTGLGDATIGLSFARRVSVSRETTATPLQWTHVHDSSCTHTASVAERPSTSLVSLP